MTSIEAKRMQRTPWRGYLGATLASAAALLAFLLLVPRDFSMGPAWVALHSMLEILSVAIAGMVFMVGRDTTQFRIPRAGAYISVLFLMVVAFDIAHLLSFPGMPDWLTPNQDSKSIAFWLLGRLFAALGLLACVSMDWSRMQKPFTANKALLVALVMLAVLIPGTAQLAQMYPRLFWLYPGLTVSKTALECIVLAILLMAMVMEWLRRSPAAQYSHAGMLSTLAILVMSECCFLGYAENNGASMLAGHVYKVLGYFVLYQALLKGMVAEPYRLLAQAKLLAARKGEDMEAVFRSAPDGVMLVDDAGLILRINPRFAEMMGYSEVQVLGKSVEDLLPIRLREGHRDKVNNYMRAAHPRTMALGRELHARRADGSEFPVDISLSPATLDGRRCVIASLRDVSERTAIVRRLTASELRVRSFLDNSVDWVWETDATGAITYSSQRVTELLGYEPEECIGRNLIWFMTDNDALELSVQIREIMLQQLPLLHLDHVNSSKSGDLRTVETNARPFFDADGRFMGYRGVTRDVTHQRRLQLDLARSERIFRHAFDDFPTGMVFADTAGELRRVNNHLMNMLGYTLGEMDGLSLVQLFPMEQRWQISKDYLDLCEGRLAILSADLQMLRKSGQILWVRLSAVLVDQTDVGAGTVLLKINNISAEKEAADHNARLLAIIERMGDTVAVSDSTGKNLYLNPYGRTMMGIGLGEDISHETLDHHHPAATAHFLKSRALPQAKKNGVWEGETKWRTRSGEEIPTWQVVMAHKGVSDNVEYWTTVARDIRERKMMEDRLSYQATHDALTGLPNRLLLRDRLQQAIAAAKRERKLLAVVFADLDNFKRINDTLGHSHGDQVLTQVSKRLRECLRSTDTLARQGGDEFIAVLAGLGAVNDVIGIVDKVVEALGKPFVVDGREIYVTCSLGVSVYPFDHDNVDELLRKADVAMYRAKEQGRNGYRFYTSDMDERFNQDLQMEVDLRHAIRNDELFLMYQPKVSLGTGKVVGFEALVRWQHPHRGLVSPAEFIPLAERSMLIAELGEWVLREACRQICQWRKEGHATLPVAVNVSAQQFEYSDVARLIRTALAETQLDGDVLELEITEGVLMRDPFATTRTLAQIKQLGVHIEVDDFGTGYSSLGYLKHFPVDVLKIDRSFVNDVATSADDASIVRAIVSMAHNLSIQVVAEGVETVEQLAFLRDCECDFVQGFLFGKPMQATQAIGFADNTPFQLAQADGVIA